MISIIKQLETWISDNRQMLKEQEIKLTEKIPEAGSNIPWKASIGLEYKAILVSYTVWERTRFQTELLVLNALNEKTVVMEDASPDDPSIIHADLDNVVKNLLSGSYRKMGEDA